MTRRDSTDPSSMAAPRVSEPVFDHSGQRAVVQHVRADSVGQASQIVITLPTGEDLVLPLSLVKRNREGALTLPFAFDEVDQWVNENDDESLVIPVVTEEINLRKEEHVTGRVRITKTVHEREAVLEETVRRDEVDVERVTVNRVVDEVSDHYYEGDTLVIPIYTEVLVVEKRLMIAEELRITKHRHEQPVQENVTLRDEEVTVERIDERD